ncbi:MAG: undecaprenyldiphospho-muramoylpentapeptide beta-N-acetylglucosaminyltransferase, partial [Oscillospiraceae bacterium]|nr:undecaprenyldiphospho-muramoylpentapeptide beta-N-acetylglucosaminyltransferase [Oscillospiraceae bacterium]
TGGHINPALAVAGYIRQTEPTAEILFVGTAEKMEARLVPAAGFAFRTIDISGFQRKLSLENLKRNLSTLSKLLRASSQAKKILREFQPDVVVGFGGYVSGPVLRMASKLGIPTAIHEQNAYPGVTNKALAKKADAVMLTVAAAEQYLKTKQPCEVTGLPVRGEITAADRDFARAELHIPDGVPMVLSMGGSLGARAINEAVVDCITRKKDDNDCYFHHAYGQYGKWVPDKLHENGVDFENRKNIIVREYIDDMDRCLAAADLVICRAGASSLSEFEAVGRASILIPSPNVAENHQYHNAMALVRNDAAVMIEEKDLTGEKLCEEVNRLLRRPERLREIGANAKKMAIPDTLERITAILSRLAGE